MVEGKGCLRQEEVVEGKGCLRQRRGGYGEQRKHGTYRDGGSRDPGLRSLDDDMCAAPVLDQAERLQSANQVLRRNACGGAHVPQADGVSAPRKIRMHRARPIVAVA